MATLEVRSLSRSYAGAVVALAGTSFTVRDGRIAAEGTPAELKQRVAFKVNQPTMEDVFMELLQ